MFKNKLLSIGRIIQIMVSLRKTLCYAMDVLEHTLEVPIVAKIGLSLSRTSLEKPYLNLPSSTTMLAIYIKSPSESWERKFACGKKSIHGKLSAQKL